MWSILKQSGEYEVAFFELSSLGCIEGVQYCLEPRNSNTLLREKMLKFIGNDYSHFPLCENL